MGSTLACFGSGAASGRRFAGLLGSLPDGYGLFFRYAFRRQIQVIGSSGPAPPTPEDEECHCDNLQSVMLRGAFTSNPIKCVVCNGEVLPERIRFDWRLAEDIASWRSIFQSLYYLWLDSAEYEAWAAEKLSDPNGRVNVRGRSIVEALNQHLRAYYWWFENTDRDDYVPASRCPICGESLREVEDREYRKCETCSLMM